MRLTDLSTTRNAVASKNHFVQSLCNLILFREYRKRVRVIDFKDPGYLNSAMNESLVQYETCLARLGYPHNIQDVIRGDEPQTNNEAQQDPEMVKAQAERLKRRSCSLIDTYVTHCQAGHTVHSQHKNIFYIQKKINFQISSK